MKKCVLCLLLLTVLTGCTAAGPSANALTPPPLAPSVSAGLAAPAEPALPVARDVATIRLLINKGEWDVEALERSLSETNRLLAEKGVPAQIELMVEEFGSNYRQIITNMPENTILPTGSTSFAEMATTGAFADLTDDILLYDGLYRSIEDSDWRDASVQGRIYGYPLVTNTTPPERFGMESGLAIRQDILDELGAQPPQTPQELLDLCDRAQAAKLNSVVAYMPNYPPYALHRAYDEWPFYVSANSLFIFDTTSEVKSYLDSPVFQADADFLRTLYRAGRLMVFRSNEDYNRYRDQWNVLAALNGSLPNRGSPMADKVTVAKFSPEKPDFTLYKRVGQYLCVSSATRDTSAVLTLLDAIYSNYDIHTTFVYGEKGVDWEDGPGGTVKRITNTPYGLSQASLLPPPSEWPYPLISDNWPTDNIIPMPGVQFTFIPPSELYQKVYAAAGSTNVPGILNYRFTNMIESTVKMHTDNLYAAGYAELLAECQKQYEEYLQN